MAHTVVKAGTTISLVELMPSTIPRESARIKRYIHQLVPTRTDGCCAFAALDIFSAADGHFFPCRTRLIFSPVCAQTGSVATSITGGKRCAQADKGAPAATEQTSTKPLQATPPTRVALHGFKWQRFSSGTRLKAEWDLVLAKRRVLHETLPQIVGALMQGEHVFRAASLWNVRVHWVGQNTHRPDGRTMRKRCTPSGTKLLRE